MKKCTVFGVDCEVMACELTNLKHIKQPKCIPLSSS